MKKIFKKVSLMTAALAVMAFSAFSILGSTNLASAAPAIPRTDVCKGATNAITGACEDENKIESVWGWAGTVATWLLIIVGIICVFFIIWGGIRYATSGGDAEKVKKAKNTILYALIGLAVAILAGVITSILTNTLTDTFKLG